MRVYLCRHAQAAPGTPDALRELTPEGHAQAAALGERIAASDRPPRIVLTSPLVRARQTGEEIARAAHVHALVEDALAPGATLDGLRAAIAGLDEPVVAVGHQPDCSTIVLELTGTDPGFPVAGMAVLELEPEA